MSNTQKTTSEMIFDGYDKGLIISLIKELKYFCFYKGILSSWCEEGDSLVVHFSYSDKNDLLDKFHLLGVPLRVLQFDEPRPLPGQAYPIDVAEKLPDITRRFSDIVQPIHQTVDGKRMFIRIEDKTIEIKSTDGPEKKDWWKVSLSELENAKKLESFFEKAGISKFVNYEAQKMNKRFVTRFHYPELFA